MNQPTLSNRQELPHILLASSSPFRRACLQKLQCPFECKNPDIDERPRPNEPVDQMTLRLGTEKALAVARHHPHSWVIGSDQSACFKGQALGKPLTHEKAFAQLKAFSGQTVTFYTSLALVTPHGRWEGLDQTDVHFRLLDERTINAYLQAEAPYHCAGSFKSEGLGITLFEGIDTHDPNALIGLPLIQLTGFLKAAGLALPIERSD
ncbi:nucleoside triphosphate pyrophosphatase [Thiomicrospira sp. WB1]|uniref:Maf family protein n=1 Tax=Thiomicrospira sp. WB1 TaxID=1685380 RepID=UPI0007481014|nr:Maf family nucleotide pyrophosphatase [Thiomicrospira sp. WB1]KUJ72750.1 septum formation inhibitor Maf [Thiomicrospira sp. WB1]